MSSDERSYFLCGLCTGIAVGIFWAPGPGSKTRSLIAETVAEGGEAVSRKGEEIRGTLFDAIRRTQRAALTTTQGILDAFEKGKAELSS